MAITLNRVTNGDISRALHNLEQAGNYLINRGIAEHRIRAEIADLTQTIANTDPLPQLFIRNLAGMSLGDFAVPPGDPIEGDPNVGRSPAFAYAAFRMINSRLNNQQ